MKKLNLTTEDAEEKPFTPWMGRMKALTARLQVEAATNSGRCRPSFTTRLPEGHPYFFVVYSLFVEPLCNPGFPLQPALWFSPRRQRLQVRQRDPREGVVTSLQFIQPVLVFYHARHGPDC